MNDTTKRYPRSLAEAFPDERYPAVQRYSDPTSYRWPLVVVLCIIMAIVGYHVFSTGIPAFMEAMDVQEAHQDAIKQAQSEKRKQAALQAMCGGPESTPVALGGGMYDCVNKRGFKQELK